MVVLRGTETVVEERESKGWCVAVEARQEWCCHGSQLPLMGCSRDHIREDVFTLSDNCVFLSCVPCVRAHLPAVPLDMGMRPV